MSVDLIKKFSLSTKINFGYIILAIAISILSAIVYFETSKNKAEDFSVKNINAASLTNQQRNELNQLYSEKESSDRIIKFTTGIGLILVFTIGIVSLRRTKTHITTPINEIQALLTKLKDGEVVEGFTIVKQDEIGQLKSTLNAIIEEISIKTTFALEIGKGNYSSSFEAVSKNDSLGNALLDMRKNLQQNGEEERSRNWANVGIANLNDILRQTHLTNDQLYDEIIRFIVKYLEATQGALFEYIADTQEPYLKMVACYAYERKKYFDKTIALGEGLVGQCVVEKEMIFMTEIPITYLTITSGLGNALPSSLCMMPLLINETVVGVLELASFKVFKSHELEFIKRTSENLASTLSVTKVNENTKFLLEESNIRAEEMKAQEEEMRQNLEELQTTQEDLQRVQEELKKKNVEVEEKMTALEQSEIGMLELKISGTIISVNSYFLKLTGYQENEVIGKHYKMFFSPEFIESAECQELWYNMRSGDLSTEQYPRIGKHGQEINLRSSYKSVCDTQGFPYKILCLCLDLSGIKVTPSLN